MCRRGRRRRRSRTRTGWSRVSAWGSAHRTDKVSTNPGGRAWSAWQLQTTLPLMNLVGEVLFCVDCEAARTSALESESAATSTPPARRIATKTDANGDALCSQCLDARLSRRRAEYARKQLRAAVGESQVAQDVARESTATRTWSSTRLVRPTASAEQPRGRSKARTSGRPVSVRLASVQPETTQALDRKTQLRFAEVVTELGFDRAEQLLRELRALPRSITRRT
jgi:hypothetical protein